MTAPIALADDHDVALYQKIYAKAGRLHIPGLLREADAQRLHAALIRATWNLTIVRSELVYNLTQAELAAMDAAKRAAFAEEVNAYAVDNYEGRYSTSRLTEQGEPYAGDIAELGTLVAFLNSKPFLDFITRITLAPAVHFADAQATRYDPGDFLHRHRDVQNEKKRQVAYILNLTPRWLAEWGGLLGFLDEDGHVAEAYTPAWNALNILNVEQLHYVSAVSAFAPTPRYSITGWLRAR